MSAANKALREKPIIGHLAVLTITLISVFTAFALDQNVNETDKINNKADINYVDDADRRLIQYVDTKFKEHRTNDERVYRNLKEVIELNMNEMKAIVEGQAKYMQSVDRRLERIENKDN